MYKNNGICRKCNENLVVERGAYDSKCISCGKHFVSNTTPVDIICNDCLKKLEDDQIYLCRKCGSPIYSTMEDIDCLEENKKNVSAKSVRGRAYRRKVRARKIAHKKYIVRDVYRYDVDRWFKHEGQYDKGKVHCGCHMCSDKTSNIGPNHKDIRNSLKYKEEIEAVKKGFNDNDE